MIASAVHTILHVLLWVFVIAFLIVGAVTAPSHAERERRSNEKMRRQRRPRSSRVKVIDPPAPPPTKLTYDDLNHLDDMFK